jgi:hypothetical protein
MMGDGSMRFLEDKVNFVSARGLITAAGRDAISSDQYSSGISGHPIPETLQTHSRPKPLLAAAVRCSAWFGGEHGKPTTREQTRFGIAHGVRALCVRGIV